MLSIGHESIISDWQPKKRRMRTSSRTASRKSRSPLIVGRVRTRPSIEPEGHHSGDGSSLWVITNNTDFGKGLVRLLGREQAIGHACHITSDEVMTWDQWYRITAEAPASNRKPSISRATSRPPASRFARQPDWRQGRSVVSTIPRSSASPPITVPIPFTQGIRKTIAWFDADPPRRLMDDEANTRWDRPIDASDRGTTEALRVFRE